MPSSHLILCRPLLLLPPIPPSIRVFSNESTLPMRWPRYWNFSFSITPSKEHPGLISFRMDWLDLLAVQGTLKSLLQHHSSKASILQCSAFFTVQLSHPYMTTGKTIALTRRTFGKVPYLLYFEIVHDSPWWANSHAAASNKSTFLNQQLCSCGELQLMGIDNPQFKTASSPRPGHYNSLLPMSPVLLTTAI